MISVSVQQVAHAGFYRKSLVDVKFFIDRKTNLVERRLTFVLWRKIMKKVVIASDHGAVELKEKVVAFLKSRNFAVTDMGVSGPVAVDYPDMAVAACSEFKKGGYDFGILLCGTGIGISICANKIKGIRCALLFDLYSAEMAKAHNNANFIAFGGRITYATDVNVMIDKFMDTRFAGERHERRISKMMALENLP